FSPLFIGEDSSTKEKVVIGGDQEGFQSPLHRGRLFNESSAKAALTSVMIFQSPLHRGRLFNDWAFRADAFEAPHFQSPLHRGRLFNRFLSLAISTTCRQYSIRFFATALFAEKPGRFAKTLIECALEPSIKKYLRSSYGIRSPHSDS
ncbi:MAG: hypothetical protein WBM24_23595, partial [Candidatus Sulfotelmatobacter sp.]